MAAPVGHMEEIRFAVVLNGGVSLAVWIGGVTVEIDRLTRREGPYAALLDLVGASARADVITGTSAGGINGAALALAQLNSHADLRALRELWAQHGRMEALLRTPFAGSPASLLKGDEYFLPTLEQALGGLTSVYDAEPASRRPMNLGITATLLEGGRKVTSDSLGQVLPQAMHAGLLTFRHLEDTAVDDFATDAIDRTVKRLALAARSSAGFPVAFEPSFLPVAAKPADGTEPAVRDDGRPDLRGIANWFGVGDSADQSRFAVDGGVLVNTPTLKAIEAIENMPTRGRVRRVMLLVYPHAPVDIAVAAERAEEPPTVVEALSQMFGAMRNEAGRTHVEAVEAHNQRAANKRGGRADVLVSLWRENRAVGQRVQVLNDTLYVHYRNLRIHRAARDLAQRAKPVEGWSHERALRAVELAQCQADSAEKAPTPRLPYVWDGPDWGESDLTSAKPGWPWGITTAQHIVEDVFDLVRRLSWVTRQEQSRAGQEGGVADAFAGAFGKLSHARAELSRLREDLDNLWLAPELDGIGLDAEYWALRLRFYRTAYLDGRPLAFRDFERLAPAADPDSADAEALALALQKKRHQAFDARWEALVKGHKGLPREAVYRHLKETLAGLRKVKSYLNGVPDEPPGKNACDLDKDVLTAWKAFLGESEDDDVIIKRLVQLDVVTSCLTTGPDEGAEQIIELTQISLQTRSAFQTVTQHSDEKLGGNRLGRFAGFLKESWRVNDWTWGRLDAASMLCRVVLDPERLRHAATDDGADAATRAEQKINELMAGLFPGESASHPLVNHLREKAQKELADYVYAAAQPVDLPASLTALADLFALSIQTAIASEELPALANAVTADRRDGAPANSAGARFVADNEVLLAHLRTLPPVPRAPIPPAPGVAEPPETQGKRASLGLQALSAFDRAGVGREALNQEAASDLMIRTAATAMATAVTMVDSPRLGIKAVKPFTRVLRGLALMPYWLSRGLAGGSKIAQALALAGLALGAALLGLSLLTNTPAWATLLGVGSLLGGIGYSALRSGSLLHGLVLTLPVMPLGAYAAASRLQTNETGAASSDNAAPVAVLIGLLVFALYLLGSLRNVLQSPKAVVLDEWRALVRSWMVWGWRRRVGAFLIVLAVLLAGIGAVQVSRSGSRIRHTIESWFPLDNSGWIILGIAGVVWFVVTAFFADRGSRKFQVWYLKQEEGSFRRITHPAAVAAAWACVYAWIGVALTAWLLWYADDQGIETVPERGWAPGDWTPNSWAFATSVWAVATASILLFVAVFLLPYRAEVRFRQQLIRQVRSGAFALPPHESADGDRDALLQRLKANGTSYRYLVKKSGPAEATLTTVKGHRLAAKLRRERTRAI